jgi:penicillin-binding protein 1A
LIRAPVAADVARNPATAAARRSMALQAMVRAHRITGVQRAEVESVGLQTYVVAPEAADAAAVASPDKGTQYFVDFVRRQLLARFGEAAVFTGGLRVRTTLDLALQAKAYDAVYGFLRPGEPAGALVAVDDQGQIKAMVGGRDWAASKVNLAIGRDGGGAGRQAGSTFKPFLLAAAVRDGYSVQSALPGPAKVIIPKADNGKDWPVANYENEDAGGSVSLIDATAESVNTVYAQLETAVGAPKLVDMAHQLGVASPLAPNASLVLGTGTVSVLEMAAAYSTFANRGVRVDGDAETHGPAGVVEVTSADGTVLYRSQPLRTKVLERSQADVVNYCLRQVVERGTGTGARLIGAGPGVIAGKTGTTDDFGDAWFVGYTPTLTAAVWMGWADGSARKMTDVRGRRVNGGSYPATIWKRFMDSAVTVAGSPTFPDVKSFTGKRVTGVKAILPTTTTVPPPATTAPAAPAPTPPTPPTTAPPPATPPPSG